MADWLHQIHTTQAQFPDSLIGVKRCSRTYSPVSTCLCPTVTLLHSNANHTLTVIAGLSTQEILEQNSHLLTVIKELRRKSAFISELIVDLDIKYQQSKRYVLVQRYRLLKNMIKHVIHNQWLDG